MCSFIFFRSKNPITEKQLRQANRFSQSRGPDRTNTRTLSDSHGWHVTMLHNLLDISGTTSAQPTYLETCETKLHLLFNGEIYNYRDFGSFHCDTECILPTWRQMDKNCSHQLDGEFAILIYDENRGRVFVLADTFLTKPIYFGIDKTNGAFGIATCASSLKELGLSEIEMFRANSLTEFQFTEQSTVLGITSPVFNFSVEQNEQSYDAWNHAFLHSISKRARHGKHTAAVALSSGYDSGAICLALNLLDINYDSFSILSGENTNILNERISLNRHASCQRSFVSDGLTQIDIVRIQEEIKESVEPFTYVHEDMPGVTSSLQSDGGAIGGYFLAGWARNEQRLVNISGAGADEIVSDYGWNGKKFYHHSEFGGKFPNQLEGFFPWKKFYNDTQRSYLFKEEYILGRWGIEGRYPFLDRTLVQSFLSLSPELKNKSYKAPIENFLKIHGYPYEAAQKRGFSPALLPTTPIAEEWIVRRLIRKIMG